MKRKNGGTRRLRRVVGRIIISMQPLTPRSCLPKSLAARFNGGMVFQKDITLHTTGHRDMLDLTEPVARIVSESKIRTGIVQVFNIGSTAAVGAMEMESGLQRDLPELLDRLIPAGRDYGHEQAWHDGNGHSHLQATLLGPSLTVPVRDGRLVLGTWQQIFLLECDVRPRRRTVAVTVMGE